MWGTILGFISGPIFGHLLDAYKAKLAAGNTQERVIADVIAREAELQRAEAELQSRILVAEQGNAFTRWVRPMWAAPFVLFTWKIVVYDKMLGWGSTDPLDPRMWGVFMLMVGAYFGGRSIEKTASVIADAIRGRR